MAEKLFDSLARPEKELALLDIVKSAEAEKKRLDIAVFGEPDCWVLDSIRKRGHTLGKTGADLSIFIDRRVDAKTLADARKKSRRVAIISPSKDALIVPEGLMRIDRGAVLDEKLLEDAEVREICYGFWNVAHYGFANPRRGGMAFFAIFLFIAMLALFVLPVDPMDDLLRHAKAYEYGFDYSRLYINAWNFSFDPYLVFDYFAGAMDAAFGPVGVKLIQMLCLGSFGVGFLLNTKDWDDRFRVFAFVLMLFLIGLRVSLGRPEAFEAAFFLVALTLSGAPAVLWGVFMGSFYFLFPIYLIPLALARKEYAISFLIALALWVNYAGVAYFTEIFHTVSSVFTGRAYAIAENISILAMLGNPAFLLLAFLFLRSGNWGRWIQIGFFTLLNQVRYIDVIAPLMAISLSGKRTGFGSIRFGFAGTVFFFAIMVMSLQYAFSWHSLENVSLSDVSVLCDSMPCMYNVIFMGDNITVSPSMELGFSERDVQIATGTMLYNGTLDCPFFEKYDYDVVVEGSLREIPPCLSLRAIEGKYRIWDVRR